MGKPSTTDSSGALQTYASSEAARGNNLLDTIARTPPTHMNVDLPGLDKLVEQYGYLNEYKKRAAEKELNPEVAAMRELQNKDFLSTYKNATEGELPSGVQRALTRAGLGAALQGGSNIGEGTLGTGTATRVYGAGNVDYLNSIRDLISRYLSTKEEPNVAIDPSTAAQLRIGENETNLNLDNAAKQQLLQATLDEGRNQGGIAGNTMQSAIAEAQSANAAKNASKGQMLGLFSSLLGTAAQAGGTMLGGPIGGAVAGKMVKGGAASLTGENAYNAAAANPPQSQGIYRSSLQLPAFRY